MSGTIPSSDARVPDADTRCVATASLHVSRPVASAIHVCASHSTTFGGVPRVCRGPSRHWTAPNGGIRTSSVFPGCRCSSSSRRNRTAVATTGLGRFDSASSPLAVSWSEPIPSLCEILRLATPLLCRVSCGASETRKKVSWLGEDLGIRFRCS